MTRQTHAQTPSRPTGLAARYRLWREYRTTVADLSDLSNRTLADLGINRSMIRSTARQAVYGDQ